MFSAQEFPCPQQACHPQTSTLEKRKWENKGKLMEEAQVKLQQIKEGLGGKMV